MCKSFSRFKIASEYPNAGGTTIIKVVDSLNEKHVIGFAIYHNCTGKVSKCDGEDAKTLFDLLDFIRDERKGISWHIGP